MEYPTKKYKVLVVDPPWNQGKTGKRKVRPNQGTRLDYPTMTRDELLALPVSDWAEEQSFMWLWATNSKDRQSKEPILKTAFDLMEIMDDSHDRSSTVIISQLPTDEWYLSIGDNTLADAILDRLMHNAHRIKLSGSSMRKLQSTID